MILGYLCIIYCILVIVNSYVGYSLIFKYFHEFVRNLSFHKTPEESFFILQVKHILKSDCLKFLPSKIYFHPSNLLKFLYRPSIS